MEEEKATSSRPNLPPAGDARREVLKGREDQLQERGEEEFKDRGKIDPEKLKPDNEILGPISENFDILGVTKMQKGFRYKWVFTGYNGFFANHARLEGWVPVQGDDPEAEERKWVDSTRKLGDTLLYRISEEKYKVLQRRDYQKRMLQQESIESTIEEIGDKTPGVTVHRVGSNPALHKRLQAQALAQQLAQLKFNQMVRSGRVPGMEMGKDG